MAAEPGKCAITSGVKISCTWPMDLCDVRLERRRRRRCRRIPVRDAAARKGRDRPSWRLRDGRRYRRRRNGRGNDRLRVMCELWEFIRSRLAFAAIPPRPCGSESDGCLYHRAPIYWMRNSPRTTVPICSAPDAVLCRNRVDAGKRTGERIPPRARRVRRKGRFRHGVSRSIRCARGAHPPKPSLAKQDSASVTAMPPSLMSCADRIAFSLASFTRQSINRFSAARSIAGGAPATMP